MNISQFFSVLRARWPVVLLIFVLTVAAAIGLSMLMPKQYTATATLVVDQTRPDPVTGATFSGNPSAAFTATQIDIMKSASVALQVINTLHLTEDPTVKADWLAATKGVGSIDTWLTEQLQREMDAKPSRESNVISVSYKAGDPAKAAKFANAFVQGYLDVSLRLKVNPAEGNLKFFKARAEELRANVVNAQAKLSAYQREKGVVVATDGQLDVESARLNELSSQLVALQAVASGQTSSVSQLPEVVNNSVLTGMRGDITRAEARLQELTSRLGDNHPQVIEARANINALRSRLDAETRRVTGSVGVVSSMNRQREAEIRAALEAQRARVLKMRTAREDGMVLVRDVENAQHAYDAVVARMNQVGLDGATTRDQVNGSVLAEAVPPLEPSSPKIVRNGVLAAVLGLVLGFGAAMLLEFMDRRVRTVEEVSQLLGLPIFGVLPKPGGMGGLPGSNALALSPRGLFGSLPAPRK
jgi:chain length determinant protein EpsF